jgi:2',3'-cyclic-nucleotide 2'-phosphodiesterase (5'-nucleotidase family)
MLHKYCFRLRGIFLLVSLLLFTTACSGPRVSTADPSGEVIEFTILQLNDVYEISPLDGGRAGGMARVAALRKQLLEVNPNLITIMDGDYLNPSLIGSLKCKFGEKGNEKEDRINGRQMVETMNALGVDYAIFGNHEFDLKYKDLNARNNESKFQLIASNVLDTTGGKPRPFQQNGKDIPKYLVHTFKSSRGTLLKVGLIGLTINSNPVNYADYLDPVMEGRKAIDAVKKESDLVLGLTHLAMDEDVALAGEITDMPLVFGGHEHVNMSRKVGNVSIWKADANAKSVYIHWCKYNTKTQKLSSYSQLMPITNLLPEDDSVAKVVLGWESFANTCMEKQGYKPNVVIYNTSEPLDGRDESTRYRQTNLGGIIADAFQKADVGAELAFFNSGSIRLDDQLTGDIKQKQILGTLPFGGGIVKGIMQGDSLRKFLDAGLAESIKGNGAYQQLSSNVRVPEPGSYYINEEPLEGSRNYSVVTPRFLANGGEPALEFIKNMADWKDPDITDAADSPKNDVRDITIWYLNGLND